MEILLYISAIIAALSLLLIAIFVIVALRNAKKTMTEVSDTIARMENKLGGITTKSNELMERTNRIAADVESKIQRLESISQSAQHIGQSTENLNRSFQSISHQIATPEPKQRELMEKLTILTETASRMYFKFKSVKRKQDPFVQQELNQLPSPQKVK
ncbi:DUF948 domain-containing protein [Sporosarcina sp. 179-K 8C2 HS]|uniref:DUF948 domain-containing protein n=1 Tax=Sporosarcina sp. 179-K 8C2 HS TaxID=3142387 RepID=UPI0039A38008